MWRMRYSGAWGALGAWGKWGMQGAWACRVHGAHGVHGAHRAHGHVGRARAIGVRSVFPLAAKNRLGSPPQAR